jgi:hypothetical protein
LRQGTLRNMSRTQGKNFAENTKEAQKGMLKITILE